RPRACTSLILSRQFGISSLPSRILASSCASLRRACQEDLAKSGISGRRSRASLPVPSAPWHLMQYWRNSSRATGVPDDVGADCRGGGPCRDLEESACARIGVGAESCCAPRLTREKRTARLLR